MLSQCGSKMLLYIAWFSCFCVAYTQGTLTSCIAWPKYVTPNDSVVCVCMYKEVYPSVARIQWITSKNVLVSQGSPGQSSLGLFLKNLTMEDSGTTLTCFLVDTKNKIDLGSFTPRLTYGPDNTTVTSTKTYISDDGSNMTLTCSTNVDPMPRFQWQGHPPEAVILPGCRCGNGTFSEILTFDPHGYNDGDVIKCTVTSSVASWPVSQSVHFTLRFGPNKPQTVSMEQHVTIVVTLAAMLLTSLLLLFLQWRKHRSHVCERTADQTQRKQTVSGERRTQTEQEPLLNSSSTYQSSWSSEGLLQPQNPSLQAEED